jgi:glycerol-3-phosphate acyltransferase PlsX
LKKKVDYVAYGGAPLLGIRGTCVICHGRSNSEAIKNAILSAYKLTSSPFEYILEEKLCKKE